MENYEYYIHDAYIGESGASNTTWDFLMTTAGLSTSKTLLDVVNDIFNTAANPVSIIKTGVTKFVEGVKDGINFIREYVIIPILDGIVDLRSKMLHILSEVSNALTSEFSTTYSNGMLNIENEEIAVDRERYKIKVRYSNLAFFISNAFLIPNVKDNPETLLVGETNLTTMSQTIKMGAWLALTLATISFVVIEI